MNPDADGTASPIAKLSQIMQNPETLTEFLSLPKQALNTLKQASDSGDEGLKLVAQFLSVRGNIAVLVKNGFNSLELTRDTVTVERNTDEVLQLLEDMTPEQVDRVFSTPYALWSIAFFDGKQAALQLMERKGLKPRRYVEDLSATYARYALEMEGPPIQEHIKSMLLVVGNKVPPGSPLPPMCYRQPLTFD